MSSNCGFSFSWVLTTWFPSTCNGAYQLVVIWQAKSHTISTGLCYDDVSRSTRLIHTIKLVLHALKLPIEGDFDWNSFSGYRSGRYSWRISSPIVLESLEMGKIGNHLETLFIQLYSLHRQGTDFLYIVLLTSQIAISYRFLQNNIMVALLSFFRQFVTDLYTRCDVNEIAHNKNISKIFFCDI